MCWTGFPGKVPSLALEAGQVKEAELFQQIGKLQMELEWLKKISAALEQDDLLPDPTKKFPSVCLAWSRMPVSPRAGSLIEPGISKLEPLPSPC